MPNREILSMSSTKSMSRTLNKNQLFKNNNTIFHKAKINGKTMKKEIGANKDKSNKLRYNMKKPDINKKSTKQKSSSFQQSNRLKL